jgi:zinc protease
MGAAGASDAWVGVFFLKKLNMSYLLECVAIIRDCLGLRRSEVSWRPWRVFGAGCLLLGSPFATAFEASPPLQYQLPNGLQILLQPGPATGAALQMVWLRVGAMDEVDGRSGVAHVVEHMMFKGSSLLPAGEFSKRVAGLGGNENAFTSLDYTAYFQHVPKSALQEVMRMEADRMATNRFSDAEFAKEIEVVMEERRLRTEDSPRALLWEQLQATALQASPYRRPIIGWMGDLQTLTAEDVRQFYRQWYRPSNAVLVVVGDFDVDQVKDWIQRYYGPWLDAPLPERKPRLEPWQQGVRRLVLKAPADQAYLALAFKVPTIRTMADLDSPADTSHDTLALTMLAGILNGHKGARLTLALQQGPEAIAQTVAAFTSLVNRAGVNFFHLQGALVAGKSMAELEMRLRAEVTKIAKDGVPQEELDRVKAQWVAAHVFQRDGLRNGAVRLGHNWVQGFGFDVDDKILAAIGRVTPAQVQAVAAKYFGDDQLTIAELVPVPRTQAPRSPAMTGGRH